MIIDEKLLNEDLKNTEEYRDLMAQEVIEIDKPDSPNKFHANFRYPKCMKAFYLFLDEMDENGLVYMTQQELADKLSCSRTTINSYLSILKESGYIEQEEGKLGRYIVTIKGILERGQERRFLLYVENLQQGGSRLPKDFDFKYDYRLYKIMKNQGYVWKEFEEKNKKNLILLNEIKASKDGIERENKFDMTEREKEIVDTLASCIQEADTFERKINESIMTDKEKVFKIDKCVNKVNSLMQKKKVEQVAFLAKYSYCTECGQKIKNEWKFCKYCGSKVDDDTFEPNENWLLRVQDTKNSDGAALLNSYSERNKEN